MSDTTTSETGPDDEPEGPNRPRPWHRSTAGSYVGGVAAGAARWLDVDPLLVRIGLVVVAVLWPLTIVGYAALWLLLPSDADARPLLVRLREPTAGREVLGAAVLAVAVALLLPDLRPGGSRSLQLGIVLVGTGVALLARPAPPSVDTPSVAAPAVPLAAEVVGHPRSRPRLPAIHLRRTRTRSRPFLTPLALSLVLLLAGVIAGYEWAGGSPVAPGTIVSLLLVLVGATLVVSARWGRARGLLVLVVPLLAGWVAFSLTDVPRHPGFGGRNFTLTSAADVRKYTLGAGPMAIDGSRLALEPGQHVTIDASITAGKLTVRVPFDAVLEVEGRLGLGRLEVWDNRVGAYYRQYDSGPSGNHRFDRRMAAMTPLCWEVSSPGDPATTLPGSPPPAPTTTSLVGQTPEGQPCVPHPAPADSPTVTVRFAIGAGTVEVHRVEARD